MPDTGAPHFIPFADPTDLVRDWPALSEDVADAVAAGLDAAGFVKQIVTATDTTSRSTTSTSYVDASISATITPQDAANRLIILWNAMWTAQANSTVPNLTFGMITDASDNALIATDGNSVVAHKVSATAAGGFRTRATLITVVTAGATTALTFKGRFRTNTDANAGLARIDNDAAAGQFYIIEVAA